LGQDFRDEEYPVAPAGDRFGDDGFGAAGAIHFGRINVSEAELEAAAQGGDGGFAVGLDVPGALADDRDVALRVAEGALFHANGIFRTDRVHFNELECDTVGKPQRP
jgi:hypothetical protein